VKEATVKSSKFKIIKESVMAIGSSFAGFFALWEIIDYFMGGQFLNPQQWVLYVLSSLFVSLLLIIFILYKNNVICLGTDKIESAKK